jgi:hypothetical protein
MRGEFSPDRVYWIWYTLVVSEPQKLADVLLDVTPEEYVRFVAHWMSEATDLDQAASLTSNPTIDALVAAAAAHVDFACNGHVPAWTEEPGRSLSSLWYPGPDALFPNALVNSPLLFTLHGVLIEADSLVSV